MEENNGKRIYTIVTIITLITLAIIVIFMIADIKKAPYDKPTIPEGFYHVTGEWNTGYVISDSKLDENNPNGNNGNQFVWIPIRDIKKFKRTTSFGNELVEPNQGYTEPSENDNQYNEMIDSVKKYGGFYVGRYETGDAEVEQARTEATQAHKLTVKKDQIVYNYVMCGNNETGVETLAKSMYENSNSVKSTLIYGVQWDAVMNFIKEEVDLNSSNLWGNYRDSAGYAGENSGTLQKTGTNEYWKAKNIYDLAGNVGEWTMETNLGTNRVIRGGAYNNSGNSNGYPVVGRYDNYPTNTNSNVGFRIALYIK